MFHLFARAMLAVVAVSPGAGSAVAGPIQPFSTTALQAAQRAGKPVLIDVHADWCPTCRRQAPTIEAISHDPAFASLVILKLDFDSQRPERAALGIRMQSTLVAFRGPRERGRAVGITDPAQIRALAALALK